jgi:hypothetical protein
VGSWASVESCGFSGGDFAGVQQQFFAQFCTGVNMSATPTFGASSETASGFWSFTATMDFSFALALTQELSFVCDDGEACSDLDGQIQTARMTYPIQSGSCTAAGGGGCQCQTTWSQPGARSGTYTSEATDLLLTETGYPGGQTFPYCVQGNTMHILGTAMTDIVAERQ